MPSFEQMSSGLIMPPQPREVRFRTACLTFPSRNAVLQARLSASASLAVRALPAMRRASLKMFLMKHLNSEAFPKMERIYSLLSPG